MDDRLSLIHISLEKILAEKPDIVITDIKMPGISGLEMIKKCRENNIKSHFIIVSGYQEFEYAKQAIEYKADEYLLKPIKKSELNSCLLYTSISVDRAS